MCEKCTALDGKIEHYRKISCWVNDKMTLEGIEVLIEKYRNEKKGCTLRTRFHSSPA